MDASRLGGYELRGLLGEGGMGKVYRAYDPTLDRNVALKVVRSQGLSPEARERFLREARACSRISHPNIITVYAAGDEDGTPYIAMELIDGRTLRDVINEGPVDWRTATRWMLDMLDALSRLHAEGIIHRDLKPENIMVNGDDIVKLMDFGLAHLQSVNTLTQEGTTLGTVPYMSPEQVVGKKLDARSDLFSLATIYHEMITGMHPFRGEHPMAVMYSIQNETPKPIQLHSQDYPVGLQDVLDRAFAKDPDKRYTDAGEFREQLQGVLPEFVTGAVGSARPSRRWIMIVLGAFIVVGGIAAWQIASHRSRPANRGAAEQYIEQGLNAMDNGDMKMAEEKFRASLIEDSKYPYAWHNLGMVLLMGRDTTDAIVKLERAAALDTSYPEPRFLLGVVYGRRGDAAAAEEYFRSAIAADSTMLAAYSNLGALLVDEKRFDDARAVLDRGLARPRVSKQDSLVAGYLFKNRGRLSLAEGDRAAANPFLARARALMPDDEELARWME